MSKIIASDKITVNGINLFYKQIGSSGEPLVMIIGLSFSHLDWGDEIIDKLSEKNQLILFDNRDSGRSQRDLESYTIQDMAGDTVGLMEALKIDKANIFGVSMGGMIALQLAIHYPDKINKLILGCTAATGVILNSWGQQLVNKSLPELLFTPDYLEANASELEDFFAETSAYHSSLEGAFRQLQAIASHNVTDNLNDIDFPTLVITGDKDEVIPQEYSQELAEKITKAELKIIADAAHGFSYSHANQTADLIHSFLL